MKSFLYAFSIFILSNIASAQINYNNVTYQGPGCPQGTVSTAVSPDGSLFSILFDEFRAEVPKHSNGNPFVDQKSCSLSFTATLPPGMQAESLEISMQARGATLLDQGVEGFFASILVGYNGLARSRGAPTVIATKQWRNRRRTTAVDENWIETPKSIVMIQSGCSGAQGKDIRFDLKNHVTAEITDGNLAKQGMITVDSNDLSGFLKFTLRTRPCGR